jgi:hypothetical protein
MDANDNRGGNLKGAFSPHDLEILDVAYQSAWTKLKLRNPEKAELVKDVLRQKVVQIATYGVRDPDTLAGLALDLLPRDRQKGASPDGGLSPFSTRILRA